MDIGNRIRIRREELNMSQDDLAKAVGYKSRSSITKIEIDGRGLPQNKIADFARALQVTPAYLMGWDTAKRQPAPTPPLIRETVAVMYQLNDGGQGRVLDYAKYIKSDDKYRAAELDDVQEIYTVGQAAAGHGAYNDGYYDAPAQLVKTEEVPKHDKAIDVRGVSMEPTIKDGAIAYLVPDSEIQAGKIYSFTIGEESYIKRAYFDGETLRLSSDNPDYEDLTFTGSELEDAIIEGRVVGWTSPA